MIFSDINPTAVVVAHLLPHPITRLGDRTRGDSRPGAGRSATTTATTSTAAVAAATRDYGASARCPTNYRAAADVPRATAASAASFHAVCRYESDCTKLDICLSS